MFFNKKYDLVAIGDTVTDAFIKLREAHVNIDHDEAEICMGFKDKIPYDFVEIIKAVGNSANAAVSASRLGMKTALITNLGEDINGSEAIEELKKNKVGIDYVRKHKGLKTNYHYVLWFNDDRTILIKHEAYSYVLPELKEPKWIYLSSLGEHTLPYHKEIEKYLETHPNVKLAFQPGTFQIKFGTEALRKLYERTEIFFCNIEEAERILNISEKNPKILAPMIHALGVKVVALTDGSKGAYASYNGEMWFMPPYPDPKPPYERTGAGDAFSSTFTTAIMLGKSIEEALMWGPINSMSVVQQVGAQRGLLSREQIDTYLKNAPVDYKPIKI